MFDSVIKIVTKVAELIEMRSDNNRKAFDGIVQPVFDSMKLIHLDYKKAMLQLCGDLKDLDQLESRISARKLELQCLRDEVRSVKKAVDQNPTLPDYAAQFLYHCERYLRLDDSEVEPAWGRQISPYGAVLDKVVRITRNRRDSGLSYDRQIELRDAFVKIEYHLDVCWRRVVESYGEAKVALLR